jgi:hypothetical protein
VSLICAGLYYGQYLSQYDARALASPNIDQSNASSQLLLGPENSNNDERAARAMRLLYAEWDYTREQSTADFLAWVKQQILNGFPVAIAVYMNLSVFGKGSDNDPVYDHIVPVVGIETNHGPDDGRYYADDVLIFSDNGVYTPDHAPVPYIFCYKFGEFQMNRTEANSSSAGIYSLPTMSKKVKNFGIAITGIATDGSTCPVRVATSTNQESRIADGSDKRPKPTSLALTATIAGLTPGVAYKLYRYDSMSVVPESGFNRHADKAAKVWDITTPATSTTVFETIMSDQVAAYRAVRADAP